MTAALDLKATARGADAEIKRYTADEYGGAAKTALDLRLDRVRANYHAYAEFTLKDKDGDYIRQAAIHRVWYAHVMACWAAGRHPGILAPWGHGKTSQLVVGLPTFLVGLDPSLRTKVVCNNDSRAMERVMGISAIVRSPRYRLAFPNVRAVPAEKARRTGQQQKWTQHAIYLDRPGFAIDPSFHAAGILSGGIGGRCDLLVFDDIVDQKNAIDNPADREKVINNMDGTWMSRMEPDARLLFVGTPWHQSDASHVILDRPAWCVLRMYISDDFRRIEMEVYNPPPGYPLPAMAA
jgi:hypothetical protein